MTVNDSRSNRLVAVGDVMLGDSAICVGFGFHSRYPRDAAPALARVAPLLGRGEIVLGNLECLLTRKGRGRTRLSTDQMRGDPEYARALHAAGFTALGVANNHAMQHGIAAFEETVSTLEAVGIACLGLRGKDGWCSSPVIQKTGDGLRVGLLGYSWRPRQYDYTTPPYAEGDVKAVEDDVRRLGAMADVVIVSLHWGEEFLTAPSNGEVDAARRIIEAGAAVIVGHHPHVVRPVEQYRRGVICYSLGNFVTDMVWQPPLRSGAVFECRLGDAAISEPRLAKTRVDDSYAPAVEESEIRIQQKPVVGMDDSAYLAAAAESVSRQRRAAYGYAIRNSFRYSPAVLVDLVGTTLRNKVAALVSPLLSRGERLSSPSERARARRTDYDAAGSLSVLHVAAPAHFGGLESVLRELAAGQAQRGHAVRVALVLSPGDEPHPLADSLKAAGVTAVPIYIGKRDYRGERRAIRALCRQHQPDVLHTHGYRCDVVDGAVAHSEGIAVVSTCHGFIESDRRGRLHQWIQRRALRRFDAVVAVSEAIKRRLLGAGVAPRRVHLVPNAATAPVGAVTREEARRLLDLPDNLLIGWVGRLSAEKGPDVALEAFARVTNPNVRMVFLGSGRDQEQLQARAEALRVSDRVIWRGAVPNASRFFRAFDAFLLSSRTEGIPMAVLEAMAANVPIVATRVGGVPDVLDSQRAHLVESEDVDGIAAALDAVFGDPDASRTKVERARKHLEERFAVAPWISSYESIYRSVIRSA
jgi:glycosyltransferase involved in cell wall biosynthesis/poly-gamma-glutamate capsule biosynthesis protein CapA/YwtB (metallophosphatase superfamily)